MVEWNPGLIGTVQRYSSTADAGVVWFGTVAGQAFAEPA